MRILFVANVGKEHILKFHIPTIKRLKDEGWIVDVMCAGDDPIPYCDNQIKAVWKRNPFSFSLLRGIKQLRTVLKKNKYNIVYCHTPVGGVVARIAAKRERKTGTRVVYFAHGFHFYKGAPLINWLLFYPIEVLLSRVTDSIFVINKEDYKRAKKMHCKTVELLDGVGVDIKKFTGIIDKEEMRKKYREELGIDDNTKVLIYLAELIRNKNQKMLVDTLYELNKTGSYHLVLAGVDHQNGKIQKYVNKRGLSRSFSYLGWRSDTQFLYNMADICVASSIREGFGINIVEAMAAGLPVVATNNRGHAAIIENGKNGYLVNINKSTEMATRIREIDRLFPTDATQIEKYSADRIAGIIFRCLCKTASEEKE